MNMSIREIIDKKEKESISKEVLYDLPEWFGMPESTQEYVDDAMDKPFLACFIEDKLAGYFCDGSQKGISPPRNRPKIK